MPGMLRQARVGIRQHVRIPVQEKATHPDFRLHVTQQKTAKDASIAPDIVARLYCKKYNLNQFQAEPICSDRRKGQEPGTWHMAHLCCTAKMPQCGEFYFHVNNSDKQRNKT